MADGPFRQLSEYKGKETSASRERSGPFIQAIFVALFNAAVVALELAMKVARKSQV